MKLNLIWKCPADSDELELPVTVRDQDARKVWGEVRCKVDVSPIGRHLEESHQGEQP